MTAKRKPATTDAAIKNAKPETKAYKLTIGNGLYLFVRPTGTKTFRLKYRYAGKERIFTIGNYPETSLANAQKQAIEAKELLSQGIDPVNHQQEQVRQQERLAARLTFKDVAERWFKNNAVLAKKPWAKRTAEKTRMYLDKDLLPPLGKYPINEITRPQLNKLIERIEKRGALTIGKEARQWLSAIFESALDNEEIETSPAFKLKPSAYAKGYQATPFPTNHKKEATNDLEPVEKETPCLDSFDKKAQGQPVTLMQ